MSVPERLLSCTESWAIAALVTLPELLANIAELDVLKANGPDHITNALIKNLPASTVLKLLDIFNNILLSCCVPDDWRMGEVVLLLKQTPPMLVEN